MPYELRDNSATAFANDKKTEDKHPDFRGQCKVDGKEYQISIWKKKTKDGATWLSCSFGEPYKKPMRQAGDSDTADRPIPRKPRPVDDFDSDIPF